MLTNTIQSNGQILEHYSILINIDLTSIGFPLWLFFDIKLKQRSKNSRSRQPFDANDSTTMSKTFKMIILLFVKPSEMLKKEH